MKLLTKISLNFLSISLFIFLVGLIVFYYVLRHQVNENINLELQKRKADIENQMQSIHNNKPVEKGVESEIIISPFKGIGDFQSSFADTLIFDEKSKRYLAYRQLKFKTEVNNQPFLVTIFKAHAETDNLIVRIILVMTILIVALILGLLLLNRHVSQKTWKAFYHTIRKIKNYDLNSHANFRLQESDISEFDELNQVLLAMTDRIKDDYYKLKEFTENASHELQTPIAVIISKMELLLQSQNLNEKELKTVNDAYLACTKLSRLTNTLLLLSKIENRQFPEVEKVDLQEIIETQLENMEPVISNKKIGVEKTITDSTIIMNRYLAEILVTNLLKNAIRHNVTGGKITISISTDKLVFSNTGEKLAAQPDQVFNRFYKASASHKSVGLGLAIVQKICEVSGFAVRYTYHNQMHHFAILFETDGNKP